MEPRSPQSPPPSSHNHSSEPPPSPPEPPFASPESLAKRYAKLPPPLAKALSQFHKFEADVQRRLATERKTKDSGTGVSSEGAIDSALSAGRAKGGTSPDDVLFAMGSDVITCVLQSSELPGCGPAVLEILPNELLNHPILLQELCDRVFRSDNIDAATFRGMIVALEPKSRNLRAFQ